MGVGKHKTNSDSTATTHRVWNNSYRFQTVFIMHVSSLHRLNATSPQTWYSVFRTFLFMKAELHFTIHLHSTRELHQSVGIKRPLHTLQEEVQ